VLAIPQKRFDKATVAFLTPVNGRYKTELIERHGRWRSLDELKLATLEYIARFNHRRLHSACGYRPPAEYEAVYYDQHNVPVGAR
jgi:putative transposase